MYMTLAQKYVVTSGMGVKSIFLFYQVEAVTARFLVCLVASFSSSRKPLPLRSGAAAQSTRSTAHVGPAPPPPIPGIQMGYINWG